MVKHLIPIGAPASGKGYSQKRLKVEFGDSMFTISTGEMIRRRLKKDPDFAREYGTIVARGDLVNDEHIIAMAENEYKVAMATPNHSIIYWDGVFRTVQQVGHFVRRGILASENTCSFVLHASKLVCAHRYEHRNETQRGERPDMHSFHHRFDVFHDHKPSLVGKMAQAGIRIVHIDANRDLEKEVIPDVVALAKALHTERPANPVPQLGLTDRERARLSLQQQPWVTRRPALAMA